jgi:Uma2 family endonuclease
VEFDMSTQPGLVTVAEFLRLPDPKEGHYELHHGEVVLVPPPKWRHEETQDRIQVILKRLSDGQGRARMEMAFRPSPEFEFWRADVAFLSPERVSEVDEDGYLAGAPDIVVEVLSPSNTSLEMNERMKICLDNGCRSFWVVDPVAESVSVTEAKITRHYGIDASFHCDVLNATVTVREFFE